MFKGIWEIGQVLQNVNRYNSIEVSIDIWQALLAIDMLDNSCRKALRRPFDHHGTDVDRVIFLITQIFVVDVLAKSAANLQSADLP